MSFITTCIHLNINSGNITLNVAGLDTLNQDITITIISIEKSVTSAITFSDVAKMGIR